MEKNSKNNDTSVKISRVALKTLATKAKPFESKKEALERMINQNCGEVVQKQKTEDDFDSDMNESDKSNIEAKK